MSTQDQARQQIRDAIAAVGTSRLARELGHARAGTVHVWRTNGRVPLRHWSVFNLALAALGGANVPDETLRAAYDEDGS